MEITSKMVRDLRDMTGAGMMECKKALEASRGNIEAAIDHLRAAGLKAAAKKAQRTTSEGRVFAAMDHLASVDDMFVNCVFGTDEALAVAKAQLESASVVVLDETAIWTLEQLDLQPWSEHRKDNWVAIHPERISGRRIVTTA